MYKEVFSLHAQILKALAHSRRLEIIQLLQDQALPVTQIYEMLDLPQANVSQHLMILRQSGVVSTQRKGKEIYYQIAHKKILKASNLIRDVLIEKYKGSRLADEFSQQMKDLVPLVHDPVCQMRLSPKTAGFAYKYHGKNYYFCASGCLKHFQKNPEQYVPRE
ncbi:hypothetical protein A2160_01130 [Candidatus Beckwithbacteria bacterium RBG_13_42_9]|uniref:HTH arsR-type domain-containing protein n=1 Tax=Candidatus Beckwithbacteria bacterium RBG_13_42_9 TaxID=1797457 RepID=A0A1F5E3R8_9BACT|nr:MAG: hypothetical protein A2160_01130 [Candidatus Beckwithbacteria bacterium RBG_13_42_9]